MLSVVYHKCNLGNLSDLTAKMRSHITAGVARFLLRCPFSKSQSELSKGWHFSVFMRQRKQLWYILEWIVKHYTTMEPFDQYLFLIEKISFLYHTCLLWHLSYSRLVDFFYARQRDLKILTLIMIEGCLKWNISFNTFYHLICQWYWMMAFLSSTQP